jgi:hypothetical protein
MNGGRSRINLTTSFPTPGMLCRSESLTDGY